METSEQCYQRFLQGDDSALVQLIRDHSDGLMLYLNGMVSNITVAEDLTEETFLKLVLKKPRFSAQSSFKTWLYTIGRNLALDYLRRNRRRVLSLEDCPEAEEPDLEQRYFRDDDRRIIHQAMKALKPEYRQVLWLIYFEDFSCADAGKILGKSTANTQTLVSRARKALKTKLLEEGFVYENL